MTAHPTPRAAARPDWARAAVIAWAVVLGVIAVRAVVQPDAHDCYKPFYEPAGRHWLHRIDLYQQTFATCRYSPLVNALFAPLALTPGRVGGLLWRALNAAALLGGLTWFLKVHAAGAWARWQWAWAFLIVLPLAAPTLNCGQANPLLTGLVAAGAAAAGRGRWNLAPLLVAGACLLKVYPVALALLLIVVFPRRFLPRFLVALAAGLALPFLLQDPAWVARQYGNWWVSLRVDDRSAWPFARCYRDLWMVLRFYGLNVGPRGYLAIQLGLAAAAAAVCVRARRAGRPAAEVANTALGLAACWMTACGPATEGGGYVLLAPSLAWACLESGRRPWPAWRRLLVAGAALAFAVGGAMSLTNNAGELMAYGPHPIGGLLLMAALAGESVHGTAAARGADAGAAAPARAA